MDPITIMAAATAAFNGVKKAVELGREIQDIYSQLGEWAGHVSDFHHAVAEKQLKKPGIFDKITFAKSETAEAFDMLAAKQKLIDMEKEIYHMFLYGALNHLGRDGYVEFVQMRRRIKEQREKMVYEQIRRRKKFIKTTSDAALVAVVAGIGCIIMFHIIMFIVDRWPK